MTGFFFNINVTCVKILKVTRKESNLINVVHLICVMLKKFAVGKVTFNIIIQKEDYLRSFVIFAGVIIFDSKVNRFAFEYIETC